MDNLDISKYINIALKRKWLIIITFLVSVLGGMTYLLVTPRIYEAQTLILVQAQRVPEEFVRSIVSTTIDDRLKTISQQVTSRTNLEKIISEYDLYTSSGNDMLIDKKVEILRQMISIDVSSDKGRRDSETNAFTIRFQGDDPKKVMEVTNALASNFITENLKIREAQALGTSDFITDELGTIEKQLKEKEEELKQYREKYMGGLPDQLQTNLSILEGLRQELDQYNSNLRDAENRRDAIIRDINLAEEATVTRSDGSPGQKAGGMNDLTSLKKELEILRSRYKEKHPDIVRLKEMIESLEEKKTKEKQAYGDSTDGATIGAVNADQTLKRQLEEVGLNISHLKIEIEKARSQMAWYQKKVEETPKREQELIELNRDYENLSENYKSLRNRQIEASIAVSMEKKQQGEQFRIIDPAKIPGHPIKPDYQKIILLTLLLGLGLGGGVAYLFEMMDTSYKTPEEARDDLKIPVLASIPLLVTEKEIRIKNKKEILTGVLVFFVFFVAVGFILISITGLDTTINHVKIVFGG
jgi:polysaccharide chain length determinant protein (PEP-CTERM system associated)